MTSGRQVVYAASPLFAAMLRGGICFFDEIGKAPTCALDILAPVLDDRRTLTSVAAGIHLRAHRDFLFCAALQDEEESVSCLPAFLDKRTRPAIRVGYPSRETLERILRSRLSQTPGVWFSAFLAGFQDSRICPGEAVKLLQYAYRLAVRDGRKEVTAEEAGNYLLRACEDMKRPAGEYAPPSLGNGRQPHDQSKPSTTAEPSDVVQ
jgi:MoxR-like ATPase